MFSVRATEAWGAPESVQAEFLLERRLELPATELVLAGRERTTGVLVWIKCSDGTPESAQRLAAEGRVLAGLDHPHVLRLKSDQSAAADPHLLYRWEAEEPLAADRLATLQPVDRVRLAEALVGTVEFLQTQDQPVAHGQLVVEHLWVTPRLHWLRLAGFQQAVAGADEAALRRDRQAVVSLVDQLLDPRSMEAGVDKELRLFGVAWMEDRAEGIAAYSAILRRLLLGCVTADL